MMETKDFKENSICQSINKDVSCSLEQELKRLGRDIKRYEYMIDELKAWQDRLKLALDERKELSDEHVF